MSVFYWNINSKTNLKNVKCDYIYLKSTYSEEQKKWIFSDRCPHDPDKIFALGEFTKRYQKLLETVDIYFDDGIDWQAFLILSSYRLNAIVKNYRSTLLKTRAMCLTVRIRRKSRSTLKNNINLKQSLKFNMNLLINY